MTNNTKAILLVLTIIPMIMLIIPGQAILFAQVTGEDDIEGNIECENLLGELSFMSLDAFLQDCDDNQGNDDDDDRQGNDDDDDRQGNDDDDDRQGNDDDDDRQGNDD
ncbi:MAG TPA: hypothetical protein VJS91_03890, partial [Nitrososphaeraceae archaeon]|nr:hypothetical protein [Nitrososphaeraceae archaeon]